MKYVIFGCLLILTGFAALNHEAPKNNLAEIDLPIENLQLNQEDDLSPNVLTQSFDSKPMVKFVHDKQSETDSLDQENQNINGG